MAAMHQSRVATRTNWFLAAGPRILEIGPAGSGLSAADRGLDAPIGPKQFRESKLGKRPARRQLRALRRAWPYLGDGDGFLRLLGPLSSLGCRSRRRREPAAAVLVGHDPAVAHAVRHSTPLLLLHLRCAGPKVHVRGSDSCWRSGARWPRDVAPGGVAELGRVGGHRGLLARLELGTVPRLSHGVEQHPRTDLRAGLAVFRCDADHVRDDAVRPLRNRTTCVPPDGSRTRQGRAKNVGTSALRSGASNTSQWGRCSPDLA